MEHLPHERCNFITEDKLVLVGARPETYTLDKLLDYGITIFVNLEENIEPWYKTHLSTNTKYKILSLPIKNGSIPTNKTITINLIKTLLNYWNNKDKIYIHCKGGHGRAGLIGALFVGFAYSLDASEAIEHIEKCRMTRIDKTRNFIPTPETQKQVNFLVTILKLKEGHTAPERNDKTWVTVVKNERKKNKTRIITSENTEILNKNDNNIICFYEKQDGYYEFSNSYLCEFIYNGIVYKSSEHAFQTAKFLHDKSSPQDVEYSEIIRNAKTPNIARILGLQKISGGYQLRTQLNPFIKKSIEEGAKIRDDWDNIKVKLMQDILLQKFSQNEHCKQLLIMTGNKILIENSPRDPFWGYPLNMLGKTLMNVRKILSEN